MRAPVAHQGKRSTPAILPTHRRSRLTNLRQSCSRAIHSARSGLAAVGRNRQRRPRHTEQKRCRPTTSSASFQRWQKNQRRSLAASSTPLCPHAHTACRFALCLTRSDSWRSRTLAATSKRKRHLAIVIRGPGVFQLLHDGERERVGGALAHVRAAHGQTKAGKGGSGADRLRNRAGVELDHASIRTYREQIRQRVCAGSSLVTERHGSRTGTMSLIHVSHPCQRRPIGRSREKARK